MPEIGTSGLMSGDGKRGDGLRPPSYRAHPRLYHNGHTARPPETGQYRNVGAVRILPSVLIFGVSSFDFWPEQNKVLQFDCIAEGVFMKEHLQKGALLVALGIVVIVGGFIFMAAVLGLWLNSIGNLAP